MEAVFRRVSGEPPEPPRDAFEDEVLSIVTEGMHDGHLLEDAREMIEGVIELPDRDVADIMTPRSDVDALPVDCRGTNSCGESLHPAVRDCPCITKGWTPSSACCT